MSAIIELFWIPGESTMLDCLQERISLRLEELNIENDGAQLFKAALSAIQLDALEGAIAAQPRDQAGVRLSAVPELRPFLSSSGPVGRIPASTLGTGAFLFVLYSLTRPLSRIGLWHGIKIGLSL